MLDVATLDLSAIRASRWNAERSAVEVPAASGAADAVAAREAARVGGVLRTSLEATGFAVVTGHGVDSALIDACYAAFAEFFDQSDAAKQRCGGVAGGQRGYTPFGVEHAKSHDAPDLKEFFHVGAEPPRGEPPLANVFPDEPTELRKVSVALFAALDECAITLLGALAQAFELPAASLAGLVVGGNSVLRALHYPPVPRDADARSQRAAPHEDINLITLLPAATAEGLEIRDANGQWVAIDSPPGSLVVDAGDMLSRLTNGCVPATTHRVVNPVRGQGSSRYALPFFAHPRPECVLRALDPFVTHDRPARHAPIRADAFLAERLREIGLQA